VSSFRINRTKHELRGHDHTEAPQRDDQGKLRWQYEFLIPKYPIGTFSIYSCLGEGTFTAKPA
jgi:hypothetical protein